MASPIHFALRALFAFKMLRLRTHPQPADAPAVRSGDPAADRILLVGNGPSHGWGLHTHRLALTGQLADALAARTGRPCDTHLIGAEAMNVRSALAWIGDRDLTQFDAIVFVIGFNDVLRLTPLETWESELGALLDGIRHRVRHDAIVSVASIPPVGSFGAYAGTIARLTERHRGVLNVGSRRIANARRVNFVELPAVEKFSGWDAVAGIYAMFATAIAEVLAPSLVGVRAQSDPRPAPPERAAGWSGTPAVVADARQGGNAELVRLANKAQKSFGVELAVVSLVDGDRLYYGNNTDVMPASVPLELAFCKYTVETGEPVVIPDSGKDPRFDDNPLVDMSFINFYAGYPLRAIDGQVIGSFCLQGSQPRRESAIALDLLRQLAVEAEEVLRGYEIDLSRETRTTPAPVDEATSKPR